MNADVNTRSRAADLALREPRSDQTLTDQNKAMDRLSAFGLDASGTVCPSREEQR